MYNYGCIFLRNNNFLRYFLIILTCIIDKCGVFFFSNKRIFASETIRIMYLHAISGQSAKVRSFLARKFKKYLRGGTIKKGKKKAKRYETWRKGLTRQSRHVSMPLGGVHGMWSHQPSAFPPPSFAPLSPFLAQTGEFLFILVLSASSLSTFTPLCRSGHVSLGGMSTPPGFRIDQTQSLHPCYKY